MGPREGVLVALLLAAGCGEPELPSWHLKPRRYVVDRAWSGDDAPPASEGWRTLSWRIGCGDPIRFTIQWSDARDGTLIARIAGRLDEGATTLHVSVREGPPRGRSLSYTCPYCGKRWESEEGGAAVGGRCPRCRRALEPDSLWHRAPTREVRIRAVPPIAGLDAGTAFRTEGDALVGEIERRLVPCYETAFDVAQHGQGFDAPIERAIPTDIALLFHLPPGDLGQCSSTQSGYGASYVWEHGGIRIEGNESGYEIRRDGRAIALSEYPLPVWRFAFSLEE